MTLRSRAIGLSRLFTKYESPQVAVGEVEVLLPIEVGDAVWAATDVVANRIAHGLVDLRHAIGTESSGAQQPIDRIGVQR